MSTPMPVPPTPMAPLSDASDRNCRGVSILDDRERDFEEGSDNGVDGDKVKKDDDHCNDHIDDDEDENEHPQAGGSCRGRASSSSSSSSSRNSSWSYGNSCRRSRLRLGRPFREKTRRRHCRQRRRGSGQWPSSRSLPSPCCCVRSALLALLLHYLASLSLSLLSSWRFPWRRFLPAACHLHGRDTTTLAVVPSSPRPSYGLGGIGFGVGGEGKGERGGPASVAPSPSLIVFASAAEPESMQSSAAASPDGSAEDREGARGGGGDGDDDNRDADASKLTILRLGRRLAAGAAARFGPSSPWSLYSQSSSSSLSLSLPSPAAEAAVLIPRGGGGGGGDGKRVDGGVNGTVRTRKKGRKKRKKSADGRRRTSTTATDAVGTLHSDERQADDGDMSGADNSLLPSGEEEEEEENDDGGVNGKDGNHQEEDGQHRTITLLSSQASSSSSSSSSSSASSSQSGKSLSQILGHAIHRGLGGGLPGAIAGIVQVLTLMWLRTVMNYQCRYGATFAQSLTTLYNEGGVRRFYRGLAFALVQAPLVRFASTAANDGVEALLSNLDCTKHWGPGRGTVVASAVVGLWRMLLMPVDTCKTVLQVDSAEGFRNLVRGVRRGKVWLLYQGAMAQALSAIISHYPWFYTYNYLSKHPFVRSTLRPALLRNAVVGFLASVVSDTVSNAVRVVKTTKQAMGSKRAITYGEAVGMILAADGWRGLFGRGLKTRILVNAIQSVVFTVIWRGLAERWGGGNDNDNSNGNSGVGGDGDGTSGGRGGSGE